MRSTHTFAELEVSAATYDEIAQKLKDAGYDHAFIDGAIDMHGIALVKAKPVTTWYCRGRGNMAHDCLTQCVECSDHDKTLGRKPQRLFSDDEKLRDFMNHSPRS